MDGRFVYSVKAPACIERFDPPTSKELDEQPSFKYVDYNIALNNSIEYVTRIIRSVPLSEKHANVVVDVKVVDLKEGGLPCKPGWHTDCTLDPFHPTRPEIHHLFIWGADCRTKFLLTDLSVDLNEPNKFSEIQQAVKEQQPTYYKIPECTLIRYGRFHIHNPSRAKKSGRRLLIRVTETDLIPPLKRIDWDKAFKYRCIEAGL